MKLITCSAFGQKQLSGGFTSISVPLGRFISSSSPCPGHKFIPAPSLEWVVNRVEHHFIKVAFELGIFLIYFLHTRDPLFFSSAVYLPLPYCTNSTDMPVPCGQFRVTCSDSQAAVWYVRNVADNSAVLKRDSYNVYRRRTNDYSV